MPIGGGFVWKFWEKNMKNNSIRWLIIIFPVKMTTYWYSMSWFWDTPSPAIILLVARYPIKSKCIYNIYLSIYLSIPLYTIPYYPRILYYHTTLLSPMFHVWLLNPRLFRPGPCPLIARTARRLLLQQAIDQPTTQGPIAGTTAAIHRSPWQLAPVETRRRKSLEMLSFWHPAW